jgi:hypothetical protein
MASTAKKAEISNGRNTYPEGVVDSLLRLFACF